jgi:centractin
MDEFNNIFGKRLVIDFGSGFTKAGLSNEENPRVVLETVVRRPRQTRTIRTVSNPIVVGSLSQSQSLYNFEQPIKRGIIQNFDSIKLVIGKILEDLRLKSLNDISVIVMDATGIPLNQRCKISEILFEDFEAQSVYFENQNVFGLYSMGKTSGCVLDVGYGLSQVGCVYNGYKLSNSFGKADVGGSDIDSFLSTLLRKNGLYIKSQTESALIKNIKETKCKLVDYSKQDIIQMTEVGGIIDDDAVAVLPDGEEVKIGNERFMAPEILFKPDIVGMYSKGVHSMILNSIEKSNIELRSKLYKNIYLIGGSVSLDNFINRLSTELRHIAPSNAIVSVSTSAGRKDFQAWRGGATVAQSNDLAKLWMPRTEYADMGDSALVRRGF